MNLAEKIKSMRVEKGITQEQLAQKLFVSRTAISKWERNAGYPNLDSLKLIAEEFEITIDDLLSSNEIINLAKEEKKRTVNEFVGIIYAILDMLAILFLVLPLYGSKVGTTLSHVSLIQLTDITILMQIAYYGTVSLMLASCVARFVAYFMKSQSIGAIIQYISLGLGVIAMLIFIATLEPYAAVLAFILLSCKAGLLYKAKTFKSLN